MRHFTDIERRARIARRHAVAPAHRVGDPETATRAVTVLHATEPATVFLSCLARIDGFRVEDLERALYVERTLVKQLAMRRTLFVFPRDLLPAAWGSASVRVAEAERKRMAKDVVKSGLGPDGDAWVDRARAAVLEELADRPEGLTAVELRGALPEFAVKFDVSAGSVWSLSRVLTHLGLTADLTRGHNAGHWRLARYRWRLMRDWIDAVPEPLSPEQGYVELVSRWLRSFGPGTEDDLVWWLGATKGAVRAALATVGAVEVSLDGGGTGYVLPDDLDPEPEVEPWAALLPVLDPTVMGWKERAWYLGAYGPQLFDRNGNAGTTAWWDGRVVGCWVQDDAGVVEVRLLEELPRAATRAFAVEAERLSDWLAGLRIGTVYPSTAMKVVEWVHP